MNTSMDILGVKYEFGPSVKKFGPSVFYLFGPPDSVYPTSSLEKIEFYFSKYLIHRPLGHNNEGYLCNLI